ncbi:unnamed protein product [Clavelina lepadiformis]|uniref:Carotenoid-cleaving dioxygenase, mitochondrial n=1 Tax=Clavelina lepadiformis TaxID=159417 RepID=A0ABP0FJX6_CLALP
MTTKGKTLTPVRAGLGNGENKPATECRIKGNIPFWLNGEVLRNGPGEYDIGPDTFKHWFDGQALIHKFTISEGKVSYMAKFIESESYRINHKHNRILVGSFGTGSMPDPCKNIFSRFFSQFTSFPRMDNCSVNLANLGNVYYALTDAAIAHRIDGETLEQKNFVFFRDFLNVSMSTAHPHYDTNGDYYNVGQSFGKNFQYSVVRVPAESMSKEDPMQDLEIHTGVPMDDKFNPSYFHSFGLSEKHFILHDQPVRVSATKMLKWRFTWNAFMDNMYMDKTKESIFHVINKQTKKAIPVKYAAKGTFCFHHVNAYEETLEGKTFLIVDMCCADGETFRWFGLDIMRGKDEALQKFKTVPFSGPQRYVLPLDVDESIPKGENLVTLPGCQARAEKREDGSIFLTPELLYDEEIRKKNNLLMLELPRINYDENNGKKYRYIYCVGSNEALPNQLYKIDTETKQMLWWEEKGFFTSEPIFVKNPQGSNEDDGVVLSTVISSNVDDPVFMVVLDAKTFTEIGRAEVDARVPYPLHGVFTSSL